jgi:hypothetical protein
MAQSLALGADFARVLRNAPTRGQGRRTAQLERYAIPPIALTQECRNEQP